MINIKWYYPVSLAEAASLLEEKNVVIHGGGTHLSGRDLSGVEGIVCLKKLGLDYVKTDKDIIEIGAMASYADVVKELSPTAPDHILVKALKDAANTPCRNRISIGGSIAFVPKWSDLIGALLVLDADVVLEGKNSGVFKISDYIENKQLQEKTLICAVRVKNCVCKSFHYREVKTVNDMPIFTVTGLFELEKNTIVNARLHIVGTKERVAEMTTLEDYLIGQEISEISKEAIEDLVKVSFIGKRVTDPEYLSFKAGVETARSIFKALEVDE